MIKATLMMLVVGGLLGLILGIAEKVFFVEKDERSEAVSAMLPGYNCGGCGFPGCSGLAGALVSKEVKTVCCKPCKVEQRQAIADYLANTVGPDGTNVIVKA